MTKIKIQGSQYSDADLKRSVCSHLKQILDLLVRNGNSFDESKPLISDPRGGGATLCVVKPINFDLIQQTFEIPAHIELNRNEKAVICRRCWCDISE